MLIVGVVVVCVGSPSRAVTAGTARELSARSRHDCARTWRTLEQVVTGGSLRPAAVTARVRVSLQEYDDRDAVMISQPILTTTGEVTNR